MCEKCNIWVHMECHRKNEDVALRLISLLWWRVAVEACWWKMDAKFHNWSGETLYCICLLLTDLRWEHHCCIWANKQETWRFTDRKERLWTKQGGKRAISSPGWRFWTACFGLCVFWPATLCSLHAATRPRKKCCVSTDAGPLCHCITFNQAFNSFYIDGLFLFSPISHFTSEHVTPST